MRYPYHPPSSSPSSAPSHHPSHQPPHQYHYQHPPPHPPPQPQSHPHYSRSYGASSVPPERPRANSMQYFSTIMGPPSQQTVNPPPPSTPSRHPRPPLLQGLPPIRQLVLPPSPREGPLRYGSASEESFYQSPPPSSRHSMSPFPTPQPPSVSNNASSLNSYAYSHSAIVSPPSTTDETVPPLRDTPRDMPRYNWHRDSRNVQSSPSASVASISTTHSHPFATVEDHRARQADNRNQGKRSSYSAGITPPASWYEAEDEATKDRRSKRRKSNVQSEKSGSSYHAVGTSNFPPPPLNHGDALCNRRPASFTPERQPAPNPPSRPFAHSTQTNNEASHRPTYRTSASQTTPLVVSPPVSIQQPQPVRPVPTQERASPKREPSVLEPPRLQLNTESATDRQRKVVGTRLPGYNGMAQTQLRRPTTDGSRAIQETGQPSRSFFFSDVSPTEVAFMTKRPISRISHRVLPRYRNMMGGTSTALDQDDDLLDREEPEGVTILYDKLYRRVTVRREFSVQPPLFIVKKSGKFMTVGEAEALRVAADNGIPVPKVFDAWRGPEGYIHISMEHVAGTSLATMIRSMSDEEISRIARQLRVLVNKLRRIPVPQNARIMSFGAEEEVRDLRVLYNHHFPACQDQEAFNEFLLRETRSRRYDASDLKSQMRTDYRLHFTHGDLMPNNIMIENRKIVALLDWEFAGWYPEWWEAAKFSRYPGATQWVSQKDNIFDNMYEREAKLYDTITRKQKYF